MIAEMINNKRGQALVSVYMVAVFITTISAAAYSKSFFEMKQVERELARIRSFAAAEAGVQAALAQIGANAYTGFINTNALPVSLQATDGKSVGNYNVTFSYPNQADWVIVQSSATVDGETRTLEGRVFLDSNLSKYLVYANTTNFASGTNAQYGEPDLTDAYGDGVPDYPELVPSNSDDRAALYFTGNWSMTGSNVQTYGDAHAQGSVSGDSSSVVHGDAYIGNFVTNSSGAVTSSGISGLLKIKDGFKDDIDRNKNGQIDAPDYPDVHDLTAGGGGDSHKTETLTPLDNNFYIAHNNTSAFAGATVKDRFLEFKSINNGTQTQVIEYLNATYSPTQQLTTTTLPSSAVVYVKGDIYAKGQIGGRVSVVSSDDIFVEGSVTYSNGQTKADATHSTAFLAKDKVYMRGDNMTVSGILYAENSAGGTCMDASYNTSGQVVTSKNSLTLSGNRIMKGSTNYSIYQNRVYGYDSNLRYYRPPGIPVYPDLRIVREEGQ